MGTGEGAGAVLESFVDVRVADYFPADFEACLEELLVERVELGIGRHDGMLKIMGLKSTWNF